MLRNRNGIRVLCVAADVNRSRKVVRQTKQIQRLAPPKSSELESTDSQSAREFVPTRLSIQVRGEQNLWGSYFRCESRLGCEKKKNAAFQPSAIGIW